MSRAIIHVDMDAFYASIEQHDRPELRGKPVIVAHLGRRSVVTTASYEARPFGVHSAMPSLRARQLCPQGIFVEPRLSRYADVSAVVFDCFAEVTPEIEGLSLDEAFLDVGASLKLFGDIERIGAHIKQRVKERTGLNCSVGMAHNKLLAKLSSELGKPNGLYRMLPEDVHAKLDPLPVGKLWTVGKVAAAKLERYDITTIGELRAAPVTLLTRLFGAHGQELHRLASGIDDRPVVPDREEKSIGAETTVDRDLDTLPDAKACLMRLTEKVGERTRRHGLVGRTVTVKLRVPPFETMTRRTTLAESIDATAEIYDAGEKLLEKWWNERDKPRLRLLGITLSGLSEAGEGASLFDTGKAIDDDTLDRINSKFGTGAIRRARGLKTTE